jgi:Tfp pilus assembly ATPase PilU
MVPAVEIMLVTARIRELIEDAMRTREIQDAIATGRDPYGMVAFDQSLTELVQRELITYEQALRYSTSPDDFALAFRGVVKGGASMATPLASRASTHETSAARDSAFEIVRFREQGS